MGADAYYFLEVARVGPLSHCGGSANMKEFSDYIIKVSGELAPEWSDRLGGMTVSTDRTNPARPITTLEGSLPDQAALRGVIEELYEMHLPVFQVKCLDGQPF